MENIAKTQEERIEELKKEINKCDEEISNLKNELNNDQPLTTVHLDILVLLKIIKHCKESFPSLVTGNLLGLDINEDLEVTNCFPFPTSGASQSYQLEMMRCLRDVNVDYHTVGWYQSIILGSFGDEQMIKTQFKFQQSISKCVVIVYDPIKSAQGILSIRAYRLSDDFMRLYKAGKFTQEHFDNEQITYEDILVEVAITIHSPHLNNAYLWELEELQRDHKFVFEDLDLPTNSFLEKNIEILSDYTERLVQEQNGFIGYLRNYHKQQQQRAAWIAKRKNENEMRKRKGQDLLPEIYDAESPLGNTINAPSRLDSLIYFGQINNYCKQIHDFSGQNFASYFLYNGVTNNEN